jgi:transcriptional regulator with XRE-family HTH domain
MIKNFLLELKTKGMTQEAIADKVGVRQSLVSKLARGGECNVSTLIKFADAFHVPTDYILGRHERRKGEDHYHKEERRKNDEHTESMKARA